jgi:hypothetical protein
MLLLIGAIGTTNLGGSCGNGSARGEDGGTAPADGGGAGSGSSGASGGGGSSGGTDSGKTDANLTNVTVAATCSDVCRCLAAACPDYPFAPNCMTACADPTNNPPWELTCRAAACAMAYAKHDMYCPSAAGQTQCH